MAEKAKKSAKNAASKKLNTDKPLNEQLADVQQDLAIARKSHASGELVNPRVITGYKKHIARIKTAMNDTKEGV